jgi:hypothetical protein
MQFSNFTVMFMVSRLLSLALARSRVFVSLGSVRLFVRVTGEEARIFSATWLRSRELDDAVSALPWDFDISKNI